MRCGRKRRTLSFLLAAALVAGAVGGSRLDVYAAEWKHETENVITGDKGEAADNEKDVIDANAQEVSLEVYAPIDDRTVAEAESARSVSVSGLDVVKEARKYVGKLNYVYGGTSLTKGADCSGFICRIYEKFGINIWKHRTQMYKYRTTIGTDIGTDMNKAKAGDIVVYSGHVGLVTEKKTVINMQTKGCREPSFKAIASWAGDVRCIIRPYGVSPDGTSPKPETPETFKAPVLNAQSMYSVNATKGYGMSAEVVTAYEITKIEFLTWTDKNGRDDLVVSKGTNLKRIKSVAGGTVYSDACKISVADHGNQRDIYHNAVRIYESNGKTTEIKLKDADLRAAAGGNCGSNLTWRLSGSGDNLSLYIEGTGAMPDNWVEDQADASLHAPWYASRKNIRHVYLSDGITSIGNYVFAGMPITELVLPDSVAVIGMGACLDCAGLKGTLELPTALKVMGARAFLGTNYEALVFRSTGVQASKHDGYYQINNGSIVKTHFVDETKVKLYYPGDGANPTEYAAYYPWTTPTWNGYQALPVMNDIIDFRLDCYSMELETGDSREIGVILETKDSVTKTVTWESADERIATVDAQGTVTAVNAGDVVITAKIDGSTMTQDCVVHVKEKLTAEINLTPASKVMAIGGVLQIKAQVLPETAANKKLSWFSADENIVTIDQSGKATALAAGTVSIVVQAQDGGSYAYCDLKVLPNVDNIRLNKTEMTLRCGETQMLFATLEPQNVSPKGLIWRSSDEKIVKVADGRVMAVAEGTARIYVYEESTRSVYAFCEVSVYDSAIADADREQLGENSAPEGIWIAGFKPNMDYTGKAVKQDIRVYNGTELLAAGKDYTLSYKNNVKAASASDAKAPMMILTMKNNFSGKKTLNFTIEKADIGQEAFSVDEMMTGCNGKIQQLVPVFTWNGKKLRLKTDYTVSYPSTTQSGGTAYQDAGTYEVVIQGVGNYTGTRREKLVITDKKPLNKAVIAKIGKQTYSGAELRPKLKVTYRGVNGTLEEGTDYVVSYLNNTEVGKATAVITAVGDTYLGSKKVTFDIVAGYSIAKARVTGIPKEMQYTGSAQTLTGYKLEYEGTLLKEGEDFQVSYKNNSKAGTATIIFTGIKNYKGTLKKAFRIQPLSVEKVFTISGLEQVVYSKGGAKPKPNITDHGKVLKEGIDYTLSYKNNVNVGDVEDVRKQPVVIVKGKGNYIGSVKCNFVIQQQDISKLTMTVADKEFSTKEGKWKSVPVITDVNGRKLKAGTDYEKEITYMTVEDWNLAPDAGTVVRVSVSGKGAYKGELSGSYHIMLKNISSASVKIAEQEYTGAAIEPMKENMTVTIGRGKNAIVLENADYDIIDYQSNLKRGTGYVVIKGKGNYGGTKKIAFKIGARSVLKWWKDI